jgi:hypothetical protein
MKLNCHEFQQNYGDCTDCSEGKRIVAEENKRKYILQNPSKKKVCKIRIDGCVISSQTKRKCDYLIIVCELEYMYFIELKGKDLISAVEQLTETVKHFQSECNEVKGKIFARVVLSKVPMPKSIEADSRVVALRKLLKKLGGDFAYSSVQFENDNI